MYIDRAVSVVAVRTATGDFRIQCQMLKFVPRQATIPQSQVNKAVFYSLGTFYPRTSATSCYLNRMLEQAVIRRLLLAPPALRSSLINHSTRQIRMLQPARNSSNLQSVLQPSFWAGLIPKPLRRGSGKAVKKPRSKEWNPATFFIVSLLLIGSMSIQMIALRHDFSTFSRRADVRIELLKEIIERVQRGEEVDVEALLGTGDPQKELEWEEGRLNCYASTSKLILAGSHERNRERGRFVGGISTEEGKATGSDQEYQSNRTRQ